MNRNNSKLDHPNVQKFLSDPINPVVITYLKAKTNIPISIPVWTHYYKGKFYVMSSKNSSKILSLESGNLKYALTIVNRKAYPHMIEGDINYISISGNASVVKYGSKHDIAKLEIELLEKYNRIDPEPWAIQLIDKLNISPEGAWMIEITPSIIIVKE